MIKKIIKKIKELLDLVDKWLDEGEYQPSNNNEKSIYDIL